MARIVVKDTSVVIDLVNGELLEVWFELGYETWITDAVASELRRGKQFDLVEPFIEDGRISLETVPDSESLPWLETVQSYSQKMGISFADASSIICAERIGAALLTGDGRMRKVAQDKRKLEVRGILWVLDQLLAIEALDYETAIESLGSILDAGARLPVEEVQARLAEWEDKAIW